MRRVLLTLALFAAPALAPIQGQTMSPVTNAPAAPRTKWPITDANYDIPNFHFKSGETIPTLHLNYITLGTPHRNAAGHTDNAILLLHGTGGQASTLLNPIFADELFGPGQPLDITK
jgi:homoserine O-acetyltransferase